MGKTEVKIRIAAGWGLWLFSGLWPFFGFCQGGDPIDVLKSRIDRNLANRESTQALFSDWMRLLGRDQGNVAYGFSLQPPDSSAIDPGFLEKIRNLATDPLLGWEATCPELPSGLPAAAWGILMDREDPLSQLVPLPAMRTFSNHLLAMQVRSPALPPGSAVRPGCFGIPVSQAAGECVTDPQNERLSSGWCKRYPEVCLEFASGSMAGRRFWVADQFPGVGEWVSPLSFETAWGLEHVLTAFSVFQDSTFFQAARSAAGWLVSEGPVRDICQTSDQVWGLSAAFDAFGEPPFAEAALNRFRDVLRPRILLDENADGRIDGDTLPFDQLPHPLARIPGRIGEERSAESWKQARLSMALVSLYAALRDQNHPATAEVRPVAKAVLANLLFEVNAMGTPPSGSGLRDVMVAVLDAAWRWDREDAQVQSRLKTAVRVLWNTGAPRSGGMYSLCLAQFGRYLSARPYRSRRLNP